EPVPWDQAGEVEADLVITASENVDIDKFDSPIVVLPHGIGFNKHVPDSSGGGVRLSGLVPLDRLRDKQVWIVTSHPDLCDRLRLDHPEAAERCVVVGDPTYQRMRVSGRRRDQYRRSLRVADERRLVVLSSTWKDGSLLGTWKELPRQLLEQLPIDE